MSLRIAKKPITLPSGVNVTLKGQDLDVKGAKGSLSQRIHDAVELIEKEGALHFSPRNDEQSSIALAGTMRAIVANIVEGVSKGFERRLELKGVGYRAQVQGKNLNLNLGFSHPVVFAIPEGITIEAPSQTEVVVKGADKQAVGQVAANLRELRPPDAYKGKGIRYVGGHIKLKETKKI